MSSFVVKVTRIRSIEPIENADAIELAVVGDYRSVVRKGDFRAGELAVYIPEASLVPEWLIEKMGLTGKLAGKQKNRVKAVKLRGCLSQGLVYKLDRPMLRDNSIGVLDFYNATFDRDDRIAVREGDDVTSFLGIVKYEPAIPAYMSGDVYNAGTDVTLNYDVENFKTYPDVLEEGEEVIMTEKVHGTFCGVAVLPEKDWDIKHYMGKFVIFSKGLGAQGLCFTGSDHNLGNVYFRALQGADMFNKLEKLVEWYRVEKNEELQVPFFVLGEVYGRGVQDLAYGSNEVSYRAFDIASGYRNELSYHNVESFIVFCEELLEIEHVPVLYRGSFNKEVMLQLTSGTESVSGKGQHIREGVVVRPTHERYDNELGRVILKSVSEEYLLRKGGTEYN